MASSNAPSFAKTDLEEIPQIVATLRQNYYKTFPTSYEYRIQQLNQLSKLLEENKNEIANELCKYFGTSASKHILYRFSLLENDLINATNNLKKWMNDKKTFPQRLALSLNWKAEAKPFPRGVVTIIGPWNYPFQLVFRPLIGAIAAGNAVVLKPSEITDGIARLFVKYVKKYLDTNMISVVCGGVPETTQLLKQKFDFIFFTGSTMVGKIIMRAASAHLTPVCLELGGKNPVIVDSTCDLSIAMKRVVYGRWWFNCGQTCLSPEYILVSKSKVQECIQHIRNHLIDMWITKDTANTKKTFIGSKHYERIVNEFHFKRLNAIRQHYINNEPSKVAIGDPSNSDDFAIFGNEDIKERYMPPMLLSIDYNDCDTAKIMEDEVFGPFLTIIGIDDNNGNNLDKYKSDVNALIRSKGEPLACYIFSKDKSFINYFEGGISGGAMVINDCCFHMTLHDIPFGGIGESGMGHYGGKESFYTFSHMKSVATRNFGMEFTNDLLNRYAPGDYEFLYKVASWTVSPVKKTLTKDVVKYTVGLGVLGGIGWYLNEKYLGVSKDDVGNVIQSVKDNISAWK